MTAQRSKKLRGKRARNRSRFPAWIILMGVAALAAGLVLVMTNRGRQPDFTPKVNGAPALTVDQEVVDYGDVRLGTPLTTEIRVSNVGTETLRFQKAPYVEIKEGCWPPTPTIGAMVLKPGELTTLRMQFMMHGDMGGYHDFRVHLLTNDPAQPDKVLTVLSNWVP